MPGGGPANAAGLSGVRTLPRDQPAGDFRPSRVVDDRQPPAADDVEEPSPRLRIPRLAGGSEDAQRRQVVARAPAPRRAASATGSASARRRGCSRGGARRSPTADRARGSRARRRRARTCRRAASCRTTSHGPIIQPMSLTQYIVSPGCTSKRGPCPARVLIGKPQCVVHRAFRTARSCPTCR